MKTFLTNTISEPFRDKRLFIGGLVSYFVMFGFLMSIDTFFSWLEHRQYEQHVSAINSRPPTDWIEYTGIVPQQAQYQFSEPITMQSYIIKKQSALITWNDILYCDKLNRNEYTRIDAVTATRFIEVIEPDSYTSQWVFGNASLQRPHDPVVSCYILSEQTVCPAESISDENIACKRQSVQSQSFLLTNP